MKKQHKVLTRNSSGALEVRLTENREPSRNEILISILSTGICGTDLQIVKKSRDDSAAVLGHEGIGEVTKVGRDVTGFQPGQVVTFNPVNPLNQNEILGHSFEGIFQEEYLVSEKQLAWGLIQPLTKHLPMGVATLIEPLGTVLYAHHLVNQACKQKTVVIVGAGAIGLLHTLYAKSLGLRVLLINRSKNRLNWLQDQKILNAEDCLIDGENTVSEIMAKTEGVGPDSVYICVPRESAKPVLRKALEYVRDGGCIDLVGGFKDGDEVEELPGLDLNALRRANICGEPKSGSVHQTQINGEKTIFLTGHRGTSPKHLDEAIGILGNNPHYFNQFITHAFSLEQAAAFLNRYRMNKLTPEEKVQYIKGVIAYEGQNGKS